MKRFFILLFVFVLLLTGCTQEESSSSKSDNKKDKEEVSCWSCGEIVSASDSFCSSCGENLSEKQAENTDDTTTPVEPEKSALSTSTQVGDIVEFGVYEQDNNTENGKEVIEWQVLEVKGDKALLISKYALDCKPYNYEEADVTWETCSLRKWLNNYFIYAAFSDDEKAVISTVTVSADKNSMFSTNPGNPTQDRVFLLSTTEANKYFSSNSARQCEATEYVVAKGVCVDRSTGNCFWWLRSPGMYQSHAADVPDGGVDPYGNMVDNDSLAVRPAMWVTIGW